MAYNDHSPSGAAPVRARSNDPVDSRSEEVPSSAMEPPAMVPHEPAPQTLQDTPLPPPAPWFRAGISDDLRVPWGWLEVALFAILGMIGSVVITWGMAQVA